MFQNNHILFCIFGLLLAFVGHAHAAPCPSYTDTAYNLYGQGLVEYNPSLFQGGFRTTGDQVVLPSSMTEPATVYQGVDGLGYINDPANCNEGGTVGWQADSISGIELYLYQPAGEPSVTPHLPGKRPLMISLHGCAQSRELMRDKGNWEVAAEAHDMVVAVLEAPATDQNNCWDSFGSGHSPSNRDSAKVIVLTENLIDRAELNIDPNQVYIAGLSSGGMQTMLVGCMRPDLYAGIALASNPTIGAGAGDFGSEAPPASEGIAMCRALADSTGQRDAFDTQLASIVFGDDNVIKGGLDEPYLGVHLSFYDRNLEVMQEIYGAYGLSDQLTALPHYSAEGNSIAITGTKMREPNRLGLGAVRISFLEIDGLGHAWSSGNGEQDTDINGAYVDYPAFVTDFFHSHNKRVSIVLNTPPVITLIGDSDIEIELGGVYEEQGATAHDLEDGDITDLMPSPQGSVDVNTVGTYTITYTVTDSGDLTDTEQRIVRVVGGENIAPVLTLLGDDPLILQSTEQFEGSDPGATAIDAEDGDISDKVYVESFRRAFAPEVEPNLWLARYCVEDSAGETVCKIRNVLIEESEFVCQSYSANNFTHIKEGRAVACGFFNLYACTVGSGENIGLRYSFLTTDISETSGGHFEAGLCP